MNNALLQGILGARRTNTGGEPLPPTNYDTTAANHAAYMRKNADLKTALIHKQAAGGMIGTALGKAYKADALRHAGHEAMAPGHAAHVVSGDLSQVPGMVYHGAELTEMGSKAAPHVAKAGRAVATKAAPHAARAMPHVANAGRGVAHTAAKVLPHAQRAAHGVANTAGRMAPRAMQGAGHVARNVAAKAAPHAAKVGRGMAGVAGRVAPRLAGVAGRVSPYMNSASIGAGAKAIAGPAWAASMAVDAASMGFKNPKTGKWEFKPSQVGANIAANTDKELNEANTNMEAAREVYGDNMLGTAAGTGANAVKGFMNPGRSIVGAGTAIKQTSDNTREAVDKLGVQDYNRYRHTGRTAAPTQAAISARRAANDQRRGYSMQDGKRIPLRKAANQQESMMQLKDALIRKMAGGPLRPVQQGQGYWRQAPLRCIV